MGEPGHEFSIEDRDVSHLVTDEDFEREANALLPDVLQSLGERTARAFLGQAPNLFNGLKGVKPSRSQSDKAEFVREAGENFRRQIGKEEQRLILERIIQQLKAMKLESKDLS